MPKRKPAGAKRRRGRPAVVDNRPDAPQILAAVTAPKANYSAICRAFGITRDALDGFISRNVSPAHQELIVRVESAPDVEAMRVDVLARLANLTAKAETMLSACHEWLEDPNAPGKYNLNPRGFEVEVIYEVPDGDRTVRRTAKLEDLVHRVESGLGVTVTRVESKTADPRKLLLDAVATLRPVLEVLGKATGQIRPEPAAVINFGVFVASPDWKQLVADLIASLEPWGPDAMAAAGRALQAGENRGG